MLENDQKQQEKKSKKISFENVIFAIIVTLAAIVLLQFLIVIYFTFAGITFLTLYLLLYEWISLLTKSPLHMFLSILANFSDFGLFFVLALLCVYIIKDYFTLVKIVLKITLGLLKEFLEREEDPDNSCGTVCTALLSFFICLIPIGGLIVLFVFIIMRWLFYVSVSLEALILLSILIGTIIYKVKKNKAKKQVENSHNFSETASSLGEIQEEKENEAENDENNGNNRQEDNNDAESNVLVNNVDYQIEEEEEENDHNDEKSDSQIEVNEPNQNDRKSARNDDHPLFNQNYNNDNDDYSDYSDDSDSDSSFIDKIEALNDSMLSISQLEGMFHNSRKPVRCNNHQTIYRVIISIVIFALQLYSILIPFLNGSISIAEFVIYIVVKLLFGERILAFNLIDILINGKRVLRSIKKKKVKIVFWLVIILYVIVVVAFLAIFIISKLTVFPTINKTIYQENNSKWFKFNEKNLSSIPESYCLTNAQNDGLLKTEDFAMLTTLPRLYDVTKSGKCYIKPSMRGLFNSTMKYIFGKDYEKDGIRIMCKKLSHYPLLVITSEKILNQTMSHFSDQNLTLLKKQFDIENKNYFNHHKLEIFNDEGNQLMKNYEECVSVNGTENCEDKWDSFTQYYWPFVYSNKYVEIPGFERYQITIDSDMIIQPEFITSENNNWAGTHYIIGGSYEDSWSVGFFIETVGRKYIPQILENFLPLYKFIRNIAKDVFLQIEWFNKHIFYFDVSSINEMKSLEELYSQFNFSNKALFTIGHSITGTAFKGISFFTSIQGITFEASDGENNMNLINLKKLGESESLITNIYSDGSIFTGIDDNCDVNGMLPKRYILPSVYDTACLTAITCSQTMKYVPFCMQVLTQNKKDPLKEFNITFDAYLKHYGYK